MINHNITSSIHSKPYGNAHIEQTLSSTVLHGGDLIDALDWLCLNLANGMTQDFRLAKLLFLSKLLANSF
jgi:hypothetical protein